MLNGVVMSGWARSYWKRTVSIGLAVLSTIAGADAARLSGEPDAGFTIEVDGKLLAELNFQELVEAVAVGGPVEKSSSIAAQHIRAIISEIKGDFVHMSGLQASADFIGGPGMSQDEFTAKREEARAVAEVKADGAFDEIAAGDVLVTIESAVTTTKEKRSRNRG